MRQQISCLLVALLGLLACAAPTAQAEIVKMEAATSAPSSPSDKYRIQGELPLYGPFKSDNYAGYIPVSGGRQAFFWFVEAEFSPETAPVLLWLNGGPGCSSLYGTFQESGPYTMRGPPYEFRNNSFTWARLANVIYLESPPGVGFSLDTNPPIEWNDKNTAKFNYEFLKGFFKAFPQYATHDFHIAGESYGGHYVPQLANEILEGDDENLRSQMKGFMVGNPCTSDFECTSNDPTLDTYLRYHGFAALNTSIGPQKRNGDFDPYDILVPTCPNSDIAQMVSWNHPVTNALKRRLRDAEKKRQAEEKKKGMKTQSSVSPGPPYPWGPCEGENVHAWINREDVKAQIHAEANVTWHSCSNTLLYNYSDVPLSVTYLYHKFFERTNWSIMFYSGTADSIINFIATQTIVQDFKRPLKNGNFTPWHYPYVYDESFPQLGGYYLEYDRVSWAGVRDAGHMVPMFNPPAAHELLKSYLTKGGPGRM